MDLDAKIKQLELLIVEEQDKKRNYMVRSCSLIHRFIENTYLVVMYICMFHYHSGYLKLFFKKINKLVRWI